MQIIWKILIGPLLVGVVVTAVTWWLNQERYDVRYTISERIPLSFETPKKEWVQQLEVKNLSNKSVEAVQIKIPAQIIRHEVIRNSEADKTESFSKPDAFEFVYSALPPAGSFRLLITSLEGVSKNEVQVRHSKGLAIEALSATPPFSIASLTTVGLFLFYAMVLLFFVTSFLNDSWNQRADFASEKVLNASKPFYLGTNKWNKIREEAIERFGKMPNYGEITESDITNSQIYRYLDSEKPTSFSNEEWRRFRETKTEQFLTAVCQRIRRVPGHQILQLLQIRRPNHFSTDKWAKLCVSMQEQFCKNNLEDLPFKEEFGAHLRQPKPDEIDDKLWSAYQEKLTKARYAALSTDMEYEDSAIDFLDRQDLGGLSYEHVQKLKGRAYKLQLSAVPDVSTELGAKEFLQREKPTWIKPIDYERKKEAAERTLNVFEQETQNAVERDKLSKEKVQVENLKEKVSKQLQTLEKLFLDPSSIDRIEPYDNPFTVGNLELLRKIATALKV